MKLYSPAKINLFLEVLGKREDGYHDIESLMSAVSFFDEIELQLSDETTVHCNHDDVPDGEENLVYQAVRLLRDETGMDQHARVIIDKHIPPGSGLGGGSSNAAIVLRGLNRLASLRVDRQTLMNIGQQIGSDVNFFLNGPLAICEGRGEKVSKTTLPFPLHLLLIIPDISSETPKVYEKSAKFLNSSRNRVSVSVSRLRDGWTDDALFNRLYEPALSAYPEVKTWFDRVRDRTDLTPHLSGSGSTLFLAHPDWKRIKEEREQLEPFEDRSDVRLKHVETLSPNWDPFQKNQQ